MRALIAGDKCCAGRNEGGRRITMGAPNSVTSTFFNTVHLIPKDLPYCLDLEY